MSTSAAHTIRLDPSDPSDTSEGPAAADRRGRPALWSTRHGYSFEAFIADAAAGATVAFVSLPIAVALAVTSGLTPGAGLACAIVGGLVSSLFGGSRTLISGPTAACVVMAASIVTRYGSDGLFLCTLMAGALLLLLGATGMGTAVRFIPRPVIAGFTNGIAILLASTQLDTFFGLKLPVAAQAVNGEWLVPRLMSLARHANTAALAPALLAAACLLVLILCRHRQTRVPGTTVALVFGTGLVMLFGTPVETIASRFPAVTIDALMPRLPLAAFRFDLAWTLLPSAFAMAMLAAIQSVMAAGAADRQRGDRHDPNVELIAQGLANLASPLADGLPSSGGIVRTLTSVRAGARTPVAGIVHALALLAMLLLAAPLVLHLPMPLLAALLLMLAWEMGGWSEVPDLLRATRADAIVWLATVALTVFADLPLAVAAGLALAALLFIRSEATTTNLARVTEEVPAADGAIPVYVAVFRIEGPFLFGAVDALAGVADRLDALPPIVILRLRDMPATDAAGLRAIEQLAETVRASGRAFVISGARPQPASLMTARFRARLGPENVCRTCDEALARARGVYLDRFQPGFPRGTADAAARVESGVEPRGASATH